MTDTDISFLCREWQVRLGLAHWRIDIQTVRGVEIDNARAQVDFDIDQECALIRVKDELDHHGYFPFDAEQVIVHELLHIVVPDTESEQAIDRLARVMVRLKREREAA